MVGFILTIDNVKADGLIKEILIEGNERIETETISSYIVIKPGETYRSQAVNRSLKQLFSTGLFADISIEKKNNTLIIKVIENPIINRVAFEGNKRIDDETISPEVQARPRVVYTQTRVQADSKRILDLYKRSGRFAATVEPKIIKLPQNRVDLVFEINEGANTGIKKIVLPRTIFSRLLLFFKKINKC